MLKIIGNKEIKMTNKIFAGLLIALMFFCLCVENKDDANKITTTTIGIEATTTTTAATTTTTISAGADNCVRFSCNGSIETRSIDNKLNVAYCDDKEIARIVCRPDEGANTGTGKSVNEYSMCCTNRTTDPSIPTCDRCNDGTACGSKSGQMKCWCEDMNQNGKYESCMLGPSGCDKCPDGTMCNQTNRKKEMCKCEGKPSPFSNDNDYTTCSLTQLCDKCSDGTACGERTIKQRYATALLLERLKHAN